MPCGRAPKQSLAFALGGPGEAAGGDGHKLVGFYLAVLQDETERTETRMKAAEVAC